MRTCACGCGELPPPAKVSDARFGLTAGQPIKFVPGHLSRHYARLRTRWVVEDMGYETPCWRWKLRVAENGYGAAKARGRGTTAHRVVYEEFRGPIAAGMELDHLCKILDCVNPDHLEPVTPRENNARSDSRSAVNARKTHCIRGHELAGENLRIANDGSRRCRTCHRDQERLRYQRKAVAA